MSKEININKEKLRWRSRRSMLELDLLFARFIQSGGLDKLANIELQEYNELLEMDDNDLLLLFQGKECAVEMDEALKYLVKKIIRSF